jgi:hypothetical protein
VCVLKIEKRTITREKKRDHPYLYSLELSQTVEEKDEKKPVEK